MNDADMTMSPEEERLWMMEDDELEKASFEEKHGSVPEDDEDEDETDDTEQSDELEDETEEDLDEDVDTDNESEDDEDSDTTEDGEDDTDSSEDAEATADADSDEEQTEPEAKSTDNEPLRPVKANGMEIPVKSIDEVYQMASMGANYKQKMADIAPYRRAVSAMKEHSLTDADIALLVDIKKGDKSAIAKVMQDNKINTLEFEPEEYKYESKLYGDDEVTSNLKEIEQTISKDPEYATTVNVVNNMWDKASQSKLAENPQMIQGLHNHIKNGIYEKVAPEAARLEFLDQGKRSKLEYYIEAGRLLDEQEKAKAELEKANKSKQEKKVSKKRRAAATTKSKATKQKTEEQDFINMSDEEYDKFYREVMMS